MPRCPHCREPLPNRAERAGARCPWCREPLFEPPGAPARPAGPEDDRCAVHSENAAVGTCRRCGNYLCPVCRTHWRDQVLCIACVNRALETREQAPEEARAHRRQAILSLLFGLGAWGVLVFGVVLVGLGVELAGDGAGNVLALLGALTMLASLLLSLQGVGQAAAAIRTRGRFLILATAGLLLSGLHVGLLIGLFCSSLWQH